ncbi:hypothetical protein BTO19_22975 [Vibrio parahaemolyticus]|uniref:TraK family protein n=2 Tax=Vibrio parahaemolyticus TaxID=670 RepID=UPI000A3A84D2|nr:TraK family protein [Vibrio parahaemolyticus]MBY7720067.1 hypothetical protein [Vibrio parahaemolyticus]MCZ6377000.1 TraK family protein [Vibrio parahaemolyticus]MDF4661932.1 TraK family protein [Vibrio parahaemolyticus]MDF4906445.1 TraK family protein [Vibrio parahaemolyticus]MDG3418685.1 TraK family protein [Vibrio parahaemolyticus]
MNKKGESLAEFMKNKSTIEQALAEHYVVKFAYQALKESGVINCTYDNFRKLCNKHILNKQKETPHNKRPSVQPSKTTPPSVKPNKPPQVTTTKSNADEKPRDPFRRKTKPIHNPSMTPERRKELFG